ncbi:hypothetical protein [Siphonobacter sp. SORGH_AS_0500]|uniref:hypothetical protein n=1 Tax=Siphonobacter sp. SORGH_AS_0500 TaxID=1864824 RepID=UPI00285C31FA|nr:hypothetical protein [Siphonobacter sp. SORGH_AS_0500]MDR6195937.1 hypothetical protein [Siphonobacter sp. SORGH_AS_0500]
MTLEQFLQKRTNLNKMSEEFEKTMSSNLRDLENEFIEANARTQKGLVYELADKEVHPHYYKRFVVDSFTLYQGPKPTIYVSGRWMNEEDKPAEQAFLPEWWFTNPAIFKISDNQTIRKKAPIIPRSK